MIDAFLQIQRISDRSTFLAIQYDQVGSPPAHRQQIHQTDLTDYIGSDLGAKLSGDDLPLFIAFSN